MNRTTPGQGGPRVAGSNSGPLILALLGSASWIGLFVAKTNGRGSAISDALIGAGLICVPLLLLGMYAIHVVKGKARRVAALTGSRAFLALGNTNTGVEQLRTADGYAVPFYPVVTVRDEVFEIWRDAADGRPIVSIPLSEIAVEVGRQWAVYPHPAFILHVVGISSPISFSLYGDQWWSFLTMSSAKLEDTGMQIGLIPAHHQD